MRLIITTFFVFIFISTLACLNESRVLIDGREVIFDSESPVPHGHDLQANKADYEDELKSLHSLWNTERRIKDYSDYGVVLVYLGRYAEAEKVFLEIEKRSPGLYATAANLGTTYELLGKNKLALKWIKKAVRIDPSSHDNSEWLHVKILEAKISGEKFINSNFLIAADFGSDAIPKTQLDSGSLVHLRDAMYYQLNERVSFIKPKDKIVALLLFELGNVVAITDDVTSALRIYEKAKEYGYESELLNIRHAHFLKMQSALNNEFSHKEVAGEKWYHLSANNYGLVTAIIVTLISIVTFWVIRTGRKRS